MEEINRARCVDIFETYPCCGICHFVLFMPLNGYTTLKCFLMIKVVMNILEYSLCEHSTLG